MNKTIVAGAITLALCSSNVSAATFQFEQTGTGTILANLEFQPGGTFNKSTVSNFEFTSEGFSAFALGAAAPGEIPFLTLSFQNGFEFGGTVTNGEPDGGLLSEGPGGGPAFIETPPNLILDIINGGNGDYISLSFGRAGQSDGISKILNAFGGPWSVTAFDGDWEVVPAVAPPVPPIPLPSAAWLLLGGLGGLAAVRRKRRSDS